MRCSAVAVSLWQHANAVLLSLSNPRCSQSQSQSQQLQFKAECNYDIYMIIYIC